MGCAEELEGWATDRSVELFQIKGWGEPYFRINPEGRVEVRPDPDRDIGLDLYELALDLEARGLDLPLLVRFSDVLKDRIKKLNECFQKAIIEYEYDGEYRGVFPVKVNQQRHLVDEVVEYGRPWRFGLEAGSKPELLVALAASAEPDSLVICNGFKDRAYIETALLAQRFNKTIIVVLERMEELDFVFQAYEKTGIRPTLGVRAKLSAQGVGRWKSSAGDRAKFGLTAWEMVETARRLKERDMLDSLKLLHFHVGSQVSSILPIKNALREAANTFVELAKLGADMRFFDVGGGLAVDYDGSRTDFHASKNYDMDEYAADVVTAVQEACSDAGIKPPTLVSESGRALCAHHSVLVFEVVGKSEVAAGEPPQVDAEAHAVLQELRETYDAVLPKNAQESYHDALQGKEEAESLYKFGHISLEDRAVAERLFWACCAKVLGQTKRLRYVPEELVALADDMAAIYYCNFSVFQSAPDVWAIGQLFPIMPIHRLDEEPTVRATLADVTCDSDGKLDHFIAVEDVKRALEVHRLEPGQRYLMAMFLNGAYQEILGDLHNLFGDTHTVHVTLMDGEEGYDVRHVVRGDSIAEVLGYVEYEPKAMVERVRIQAERAKREGRITVEQFRLLMRHYEEALGGYTYLTGE